MQGMNKVLIDTGGSGNGGPVPYLPLDQLLRQQKARRAAGAASGHNARRATGRQPTPSTGTN